MSTSCLGCSRDCTSPTSLKAQESAWPPCNALCKNTGAESGPRGKSIRERLSISPSVREKQRDRRPTRLRREEKHEPFRTGHIAGGRQSGRFRYGAACTAAREAGQPHLHRARWGGGPGLSVLSRGVLGTVVRSSSQAGAAGFETPQDRWAGGTQTAQERTSDQGHPSRHHDLVQRSARLGHELQLRSQQLYPETS